MKTQKQDDEWQNTDAVRTIFCMTPAREVCGYNYVILIVCKTPEDAAFRLPLFPIICCKGHSHRDQNSGKNQDQTDPGWSQK